MWGIADITRGVKIEWSALERWTKMRIEKCLLDLVT